MRLSPTEIEFHYKGVEGVQLHKVKYLIAFNSAKASDEP